MLFQHVVQYNFWRGVGILSKDPTFASIREFSTKDSFSLTTAPRKDVW
jgi:hypothetical protein